ncbi:hypothetical protein CALVIDRAFT_532688 [Calocera viscosa TUFC12733]|uniref:Uncharacterized protein n=1 Tax=Calocera viscosa (strain TUFC12733) TaxID=1330018 RepID=A0A167RMH8_CALVF|nr:hypothetical protein CALVIDRAFT_532688 [Calocera viscosa TUFC12733]
MKSPSSGTGRPWWATAISIAWCPVPCLHSSTFERWCVSLFDPWVSERPSQSHKHIPSNEMKICATTLAVARVILPVAANASS